MVVVVVVGMQENAGFELRLVGHSLGAGSAALMTFLVKVARSLSASTPRPCSTDRILSRWLVGWLA
jgi:hypothetical protein